jgi:hypothetical protein
MNMETSRVVLYMSMSLDGFIAGPEDTKGNALGDGATHCTDGWPGATATIPQAIDRATRQAERSSTR